MYTTRGLQWVSFAYLFEVVSSAPHILSDLALLQNPQMYDLSLTTWAAQAAGWVECQGLGEPAQGALWGELW